MSFFDRLRQHLLASDADALADLYQSDAVMLSFEFGARSGRDAIRDQYANFLDFHGSISSVEVDRQAEHGNDLFVEFTMASERGTFQLVNAFVLADGQATRHFSNVIQGEVEADAA
ncbi:MAG: nuclear transport factor 2 family protein [Bacteroidota bacterium]